MAVRTPPQGEEYVIELEAEIDQLRLERNQRDAECRRLRAENEKLKDWCRKLIEAGDFTEAAAALARREG